TVDVQGHVTLWKGPDFRETESLLHLSTQPSPCGWPLRYSVMLSREGRLVAVGSTNGMIEVFDLQQRRLVRQFVAGGGLVAPVEFLDQGRSLVTFQFNDNSLHQWDVAIGQEVRVWPQTVDAPFLSISTDGRWTLAVNYRGTSVLRDLTTEHDSNQVLGV